MVAWEETHAGGFHRRDEEFDGPSGELPERGGTLLLNLWVWRKIFEGQDVMCGKTEDFVGCERAGEFGGGEEIGVEGIGGFIVGDKDDGGSGGLSGSDE